ncbi:MAG: exodeoxyribonuclease VII small subunit [Tractidigestivibacter sp.]|uniref:exodeoxyribonuclease VII small subunit n=1 Tax=Tractidigestivibacter sp. TaxID=2847320 RepID=UPI003D8F183D
MAKTDTSKYQTFDQISDRLDDIVDAVRAKDVSLERSLDLFDEAIALGSKAVELVDATDFTPEEEARLANPSGANGASATSGKPEEPDNSAEGSGTEDAPETAGADS